MLATRRMWRAVATIAVVGVVASPGLAACSSDDSSSTPPTTEALRELPAVTATVTGPVSGGRGVPATAPVIDLAEHGYVEEEFFVSGEAVAYEPVGTLGADGRWEVRETTTAPSWWSGST
jgi:hypothetical protein